MGGDVPSSCGLAMAAPAWRGRQALRGTRRRAVDRGADEGGEKRGERGRGDRRTPVDIEPGSGGGRSVVGWGERHSRTQSQARATADDGRTEARSAGRVSAAAIGELGDAVSDSGELPAQSTRPTVSCWLRESDGMQQHTGVGRVESRLSGSGWGSGAQGAQGAERGGWDLRTGQGVGSSQFDLHRPKRALSLATQARHTMFRQFKHPSSMLTEPTWSTQAELIGHESRYLSARHCLQRRVTLSRTPPSKRRTTVWFRLCHFRNGQCCQQTPRHEHRGQRERQAMRDYLESIRQLTAQYLAIGRSTIVGAPTSHCPSTPCAVPLTKATYVRIHTEILSLPACPSCPDLEQHGAGQGISSSSRSSEPKPKLNPAVFFAPCSSSVTFPTARSHLLFLESCLSASSLRPLSRRSG